MDILFLMAMFLLAAIALSLILYPLWQQHKSQPTVLVATLSAASASDPQTLAEYQAQYQAALAAIKDLDFDYEMGKVSPEDYETLLTRVKLEAARIRRQIDLAGHAGEAEPADERLDAEIEQLIAQLRRAETPQDETLLAEVEAEIERLQEASETSPQTCPHCGKILQADDQFCSGCGQPIEQPEIEQSEARSQLCPECGYQFQEGDAFCARCGSALSQEVAAQRYEDAKI
jgi:DNA-directed RNA polymerase subunit RPC12/RpoP